MSFDIGIQGAEFALLWCKVFNTKITQVYRTGAITGKLIGTGAADAEGGVGALRDGMLATEDSSKVSRHWKNTYRL